MEKWDMFTIYSLEKLPLDFGFGVSPYEERERVEPIVERYKIICYRDTTQDILIRYLPDFKGNAYHSLGLMRDFVIIRWQDIEFPPSEIEKRIEKTGHDYAWLSFNDPVDILYIHKIGIKLKK